MQPVPFSGLQLDGMQPVSFSMLQLDGMQPVGRARQVGMPPARCSSRRIQLSSGEVVELQNPAEFPLNTKVVAGA